MLTVKENEEKKFISFDGRRCSFDTGDYVADRPNLTVSNCFKKNLVQKIIVQKILHLHHYF